MGRAWGGWHCCGRAPQVKDPHAHLGEDIHDANGHVNGHQQQFESGIQHMHSVAQGGVAAGQHPGQHPAHPADAFTDSGLAIQTSIALSDVDEFQSCRDDFSVTDGSHLETYSSLPTSPYHSATLHHSSLQGQHAPAGPQQHPVLTPPLLQQQQQQQQPQDVAFGSPQLLQQQAQQQEQQWQVADEVFGMSETDSEPVVQSKRLGFTACLHILDNLGGGPTKHQPEEGGHARGAAVSKRHGEKPPAGCSMPPRDKELSAAEVSCCWEDASHSVFQIRREDYMKSKVKQPSQPALYQLACADIFAFPRKQHHVARLVSLPPAGPLVMAGDVPLPPLLIFNLQMPLYPTTLFGACDGEGVSIVLYFRLPDGFDPAQFENQAALALFKRFLTGGREADGTPTRDRLKLIPRIVNVEEWVRKGPLNSAEEKLLVNYNDKPILTRPQQAFFQGRGYFEVDLDLHQYTYLARRAIGAYLTRLPMVVWETAFVVQGNAPDELPEQLLGVSRIYRFDFQQAKPLPSTRQHTADGSAPYPETPTHTNTHSAAGSVTASPGP